MTTPVEGNPATTLLAIETAGSGCSAAVARGVEVLAAERRPLRHGHAEALLPMVERVMEAAGLAPAQLEIVAAAIGPGGFTGIRAGLAAAHGIALALGARLVGVSSFVAVAAGLSATGLAATGLAATRHGDCRTLLVALDSRRADLYVQLFALDGQLFARDGLAPLDAPQAILPDRLAAYVGRLLSRRRGTVLIAGDAVATAAGALDRHFAVAIAADSAPDARSVAAAALVQLQSGAAAGPARPFYLRAPDVTLPPT